MMIVTIAMTAWMTADDNDDHGHGNRRNHGDGDGGTAGGTGSGGGESGAVDGVEGDALLSAEDYLRIVDEMSPGEAKLACRQAGLKPEDDSPGAAKLSLRVHYISKIDPMHARFCRYDKDGSGDIGQDEVAQIIKDVGFKVDGDYINGTMEVFGQYDADGDGSLGLEEFAALWNFLHIDVDDEHINLARLEFDKYDVDGDGRNDVITSGNAHGYGLYWFKNIDNKNFSKQVIMGTKAKDNKYGVKFSQLHAIELADMNNDGLKDIVTGKRYWAHGPKGDVEAMAPAVLYVFQLIREDGKAYYKPIKIDDNLI